MTRILHTLICLSLFCGTIWASDAYVDEIGKWRKERQARLSGPHGWLSIISLTQLPPGKHSMGAAKANAILLPKATCAQCGEVRVEGEKALWDGREIQSGEQISIDRFKIGFVRRPGMWIARVYDPESPTRKKFKGCRWYPVDATYSVDAVFEAPKEGQTKLAVEDVTGNTSEELVAGVLKFSIKGKPHQLFAFPSGEGLFLIFRDLTSGKTSYSAGRFLNIDRKPDFGGKVKIDFNKAFNPPCAFSKYTTCPIPPKQNALKVEIPAGERRQP